MIQQTRLNNDSHYLTARLKLFTYQTETLWRRLPAIL